MKFTAKAAVLLFTFLIILQQVSAESISNCEIDIQIENSNAIVNYLIETDASQLDLILPEDAKVDGNLTADSSGKIELSYETSSFIERAGKSYFTANFKLPLETENLTVRLILPESSVLETSFPEAELTSDGKHIILNWQVQNANNFPVFVTYNEKGSDLWWLVSIIIAIAAVLAIFYLIKRKPKAKKARKKQVKQAKEIEQHLLESESAVIKALKGAKGEMWQKQIQLKTGFSKAKLSRTVRNLEARGLVKRIPLGNTNKVKLR
jgi:uncharacterized membrane protein